MKRLFSTSFHFLFLVLLFTDLVIAQQQSPANLQEFPIGAFLDIYRTNRYNPALYDTFKASGMNTAWGYVDDRTKLLCTDIPSVIGDNDDGPHELIKHYSTGYYNKWEAEENTPYNINVGVGVKHKYGQQSQWDNKNCWSSRGLTSPKDSLMFGPHYHQETFYHRYYFDPYQYSYDLQYTPRFRMAITKHTTVNDNENVCVIKVVHRYTKFTKQPNGTYDQGEIFEDVLRKDTLKVIRFRADSSFSDIIFLELEDSRYEYDSRFRPNYESMRTPQMRPSEQSAEFVYSDILLDNGIQFCVDWLRSDTLCTLYIDYAEVYDNNGWAQFLDQPDIVSEQIITYAQEMDFTNLKYFTPGGEPGSLDAIIPIRTIDSLIRTATNKPVNLGMTIPTTETGFWPPINGEKLYEKILDAVQPEMMLNNYFPFYVGWEVPKSYEYLRAVLQESHNVYPNFWYCGQSQGYRTIEGPGDDWCFWRKPSSTELKGSVMLALAHGAKGILFWLFNHLPPARNLSECDKTKHEYVDCIVDENLQPTDLYDVIKNNFVPRLKGTLGNTLLGLNYSGNFLQYKYIIPSQTDFPQPPSFDYLTIGLQSTVEDMNWHVGFFDKPNQIDNKYFLMSNLWTNSSKSIQVKVTRPVQGFMNYRFRNIEPSNNFDITFQTQTIQTLTFPAGEGYLFEVTI